MAAGKGRKRNTPSAITTTPRCWLANTGSVGDRLTSSRRLDDAVGLMAQHGASEGRASWNKAMTPLRCRGMPTKRQRSLRLHSCCILLIGLLAPVSSFVMRRTSSTGGNGRLMDASWASPTALGVGFVSRPKPASTGAAPRNNNGSARQQQQPARSDNGNDKRTIRRLFQQARDLERRGQWRQAATLLRDILDNRDPADAHTHLALARLEARRAPQAPHRALAAFQNGTLACPDSVHLWHAYAHFQQARGHLAEACQLYERALELDPYNPYVCHAYGRLLLEQPQATEGATRRLSSLDDDANATTARDPAAAAAAAAVALWRRALTRGSTAALVCALGEALTAQRDLDGARALYEEHVTRVPSERERVEVLLAASWLEERHYGDDDRAAELLQEAVASSPTSSVAQVALARFQGRRQRRQGGGSGGSAGSGAGEPRQATLKQLASACVGNGRGQTKAEDGRVYNAWANMEVKRRRFSAARKILRKGLELYPQDHSLLQAAGKVEERMRNYTGARTLYAASLSVEPSAPTIVAYALLEIRHPESNDRNLSKAMGLFEEALLVDPRHGPAYNAYARTVFQKLGDARRARDIFQRGVAANCQDAASIYHGYAMLELWLGNVNEARVLLIRGREEVKRQDVGRDYVYRDRAIFISHTLGMLELNRNQPLDARDVFADGIKRYGNSSQLLLGAALSEVMLGNQERARSLFEHSVLSDARHAQAWQAWGVMEMRAGNTETAKKLFESGIKNAPHHGALWQAYATMESRLGNIESARALFETGIQKSPNHSPLYQSWAFMEFREENYVQAKELISKALTRDKRNGAGWLIYSKIEDCMGNDGLASLLLRRGIECAPDNPELYCALGELLLKRGKINDAREIYEKGLEVDPMHAPLYHSLAELEAQVFNLEGLAKLNKRAKSIFNVDALAPAPASSEIFGSKLRSRRERIIPRGIRALADRIVEDDERDDAAKDDSNKFLNRIGSTLLEEDSRVGRLLNLGEQE